MYLLELLNSTSLISEIHMGTSFAHKVSPGAGGRHLPTSCVGGSVPSVTEEVTALELEGVFGPKLVVCFGFFFKYFSDQVLFTVDLWESCLLAMKCGWIFHWGRHLRINTTSLRVSFSTSSSDLCLG